MRKRIISMLLAMALMSSAFVGCGSSTTGSSTAGGTSSKAAAAKSLSVSLGAEPATMDPALNQAADVTTVLNYLF